MLMFHTPGLEQTFVKRRNLQLLPQDVTWAVFYLLFGLAGMGKWFLVPEWPCAAEVATVVAYTAWSPLLIYLARRRTDWYLRYRHPFIVVMRLTRISLIMSHVHRREDIWVGPPHMIGAASATPMSIYVHLCWKVNSLLLSSVSLILPLRYHLPCQLFILGLKLRSNLARCSRECLVEGLAGAVGAGAGSAGGGDGAAGLPSSGGSGGLKGVLGGLGPALLSANSGGGSGGAASSSESTAACLDAACAILEGPTQPAAPLALGYYTNAVAWIRRLCPVERLLPSGWRLGRGGACVHRCVAAHSWLQVVGGWLFPLALLWAWEERLRARELRLWVQQRHQQQERTGQEEEQQAQVWCSPDRSVGVQWQPMPFGRLAVWFAGSVWLVWLLLEAMLL